jgi:hypothetical protein
VADTVGVLVNSAIGGSSGGGGSDDGDATGGGGAGGSPDGGSGGGSVSSDAGGSGGSSASGPREPTHANPGNSSNNNHPTNTLTNAPTISEPLGSSAIQTATNLSGLNIRSFDDMVKNPTALFGKTADEVAAILGEGWTKGSYGKTGSGWAFRKGDKIVFYHEGGRHVGPYYGFSSGPTGKVKIVGPGYKPFPGNKAIIIVVLGE